MKRPRISRLEAHLEQIIEGTFAGLFGKKIRAQDVALRLARAMEDGIEFPEDTSALAVAPDRYMIFAHPEIQGFLLRKHPDLTQTLAEHMADLAIHAGYNLIKSPEISIVADQNLEVGDLRIIANRSNRHMESTVAMEPVPTTPTPIPQNARLVINDQRTAILTSEIVNIGRHYDNSVVLDDRTVSRYHVQLRLRFGRYVLFDIQSQSGTQVNGILVEQHPLQSGDMIQLGQTRILYLDDSSGDVEQTRGFPV